MAKAKAAVTTRTKATAKKPAAKKKPAKATKPAPAKATKPAATKTPAAMPAKQAKLLADIIASPEDKKARLVYADLLQEAGDPRGDFIALQCTRADLADGDARIAPLEVALAALIKQHKKAWTTALGENSGARWEYRRGFVEKLSLDACDLLANGARILAAEPIEELAIWKIDESTHKIGKSRLAPLLALPLHRVRRLSLARSLLVREDFEALARATTLASVELLDLSNGGSYQILLWPLAEATSLPKLRELRITGCMIGDDQIALLAKSTKLALARLVAPRNTFSADGARAIANATWAPRLEYLDISSNEQLLAEGLEALATSPHLTALRFLKAEYCGFFERAADLVLASPTFAKLDKLDLSSNMGADDYARIKAVFGDRLV